MKTRIEKITPEIAEIYLSKNTNNRNLKAKIVEYYADQMRRGQWLLTGQGITFDKDGNLIDGQHRLAAIIKAKTPIEFLIITDVESSTFSVYDTGKLRSASDIFKISGVLNSTNVSSGIVGYYVLKNNYSASDSGRAIEMKLSKQDILSKYNEMPEFWQTLHLTTEKCTRKLRIYKQSQIFAFIAYYVIDKGDKFDTLVNFCFELFGINKDTYTCTATLREQLIKDALSTKKYTKQTKYEKLIKTYNYWKKGINVSKLY